MLYKNQKANANICVYRLVKIPLVTVSNPEVSIIFSEVENGSRKLSVWWSEV